MSAKSAKIDCIIKEIEKLNSDELQKLLETMKNKKLLPFGVFVGSAFSDWDNEEDSVYDEVYGKEIFGNI